MSYSILIPSKTAANLKSCIRAIRQNGQKERIIVVWNGEASELQKIASSFDPRVELHTGRKPFVFAEAMNYAIDQVGGDDVLLLNDDALLVTNGGFALLAYAATVEGAKKVGVMSALIMGMAAAPDQVADVRKISAGAQLPGRATQHVKHHMIAFMAVYIRRAVLNEVGKLDERFVDYGYDDDDYCRRLKDAGYSFGVEWSCVVEHGSLPSTFRGQGRAGSSDMLAANRERFFDKWPDMRPAAAKGVKTL